MRCFMCKGHLEDKNTTFMAETGNSILIVKNVPSQVCKQCGEISYNNEVADCLDGIINSIKFVLTEIAVVNYSERAAVNAELLYG